MLNFKNNDGILASFSGARSTAQIVNSTNSSICFIVFERFEGRAAKFYGVMGARPSHDILDFENF